MNLYHCSVLITNSTFVIFGLPLIDNYDLYIFICTWSIFIHKKNPHDNEKYLSVIINTDVVVILDKYVVVYPTSMWQLYPTAEDPKIYI